MSDELPDDPSCWAVRRGLLTELRWCYTHALFIVDRTTGCCADEHLSLANQSCSRLHPIVTPHSYFSKNRSYVR